MFGRRGGEKGAIGEIRGGKVREEKEIWSSCLQDGCQPEIQSDNLRSVMDESMTRIRMCRFSY